MFGTMPAPTRSAPEQNPCPAPVITTTRQLLSRLISRSASRSGIITSNAMAFIRSGRLSVTSVTFGCGWSISMNDIRRTPPARRHSVASSLSQRTPAACRRQDRFGAGIGFPAGRIARLVRRRDARRRSGREVQRDEGVHDEARSRAHEREPDRQPVDDRADERPAHRGLDAVATDARDEELRPEIQVMPHQEEEDPDDRHRRAVDRRGEMRVLATLLEVCREERGREREERDPQQAATG